MVIIKSNPIVSFVCTVIISMILVFIDILNQSNYHYIRLYKIILRFQDLQIARISICYHGYTQVSTMIDKRPKYITTPIDVLVASNLFDLIV
jgi:hypothetical protein